MAVEAEEGWIIGNIGVDDGEDGSGTGIGSIQGWVKVLTLGYVNPDSYLEFTQPRAYTDCPRLDVTAKTITIRHFLV